MSDEPVRSDGKWVPGLTADTAVGPAARVALAARFGAVIDLLTPAARWGADPEPVHKLRVATRRASAALHAFGDLLPDKPDRRARRALRRLRRSAGSARDADVFLDTLRGWSVHQSPAARPGLSFLIGHAFAHRQTAQTTLEGAIAKTKVETLNEVPNKVRGGRHELLGARAVHVVAGLRDDLAAAAQENLEDYSRLHRVRILAKRLRYALELFIDCFAAAVRDQVYPHVEALQDILGLANDSYQTSVRLDELSEAIRQAQPGMWELVRVGFGELQAFHRRRLKEQRTAFQEWWRQWELRQPAEALSRVKGLARSEREEPSAVLASNPPPAP
jgi:CHAD domain-containing protein